MSNLSNMMINYLVDMKHGKHTKTQLNKINKYRYLSNKNNHVNYLFRMFDREMKEKRIVGGDDDNKIDYNVLRTSYEPPYTHLTEQIDYVNKLDRKLRNELITYTEGSSDIRRHLTKPENTSLSYLKNSVINMDKIFSDVPPLKKTITLFSGAGNIFDSKSYISSSTDVNVALFFSGGDCCLYVLNVGKGVNVLPIEGISVFQDEKEVIINRGYEIIIEDDNVTTEVKLEDIDLSPRMMREYKRKLESKFGYPLPSVLKIRTVFCVITSGKLI
jgi:hypothetical protein